MNILFIIPAPYKGKRWGGVMSYTMLTARHLQKLGHSVAILTQGTRDKTFTDTGITIHTCAYAAIHIPGEEIFYRFFPICTDRIKWNIAVSNFINTHDNYDIVESPEWGSNTLLLSLWYRGPVIVRLHKSLYQYYRDNGLGESIDLWLTNCLEMLSIIAADGVTSPTQYMLTSHPFIKKIIRVFHRPGEVIPNGIPMTQKVSRSPSHPYLLYVGRLETGKGCLTLVHAFADICRLFPNLQLLMIGRDTTMRQGKKYISVKGYLLAQFAKVGSRGSLVIKSQLPQKKLMPYYNDCIFLVLPSVGHENYPMVLLEAISRGKAVVATNAGGIPEIITSGQGGLLCNEDNHIDLAKSITYLLRHPSKRKSMERYNWLHRRNFDINLTSRATLQFYKQMIRRHTVSGHVNSV